MEISQILQSWYQDNHRSLPWRETKDAYRIWLSEVILQQTRVVQGYDYYVRFVQTFPTVRDLANATEDEVLKLWQGLGYYSRARNLHKAARQVLELHQGEFPTRYAELIGLAGVGPYTAAAIASFSSDEAVAVVDGNVYRVLSRQMDIETPIDSTQGQKEFQALADTLLDRKKPGRHNQAIMEFGALQCTPTSPLCETCPLLAKCLAHENGTISIRPVKARRVKVRERHLHYYLFKYNEELWVHQRGAGDIWQGLWEFVLFEGEPRPDLPQEPSFSLRHQLTHQLLLCNFYLVEVSTPDITLPDGYVRVTWEEWQEKAVPKPIIEANQKFSSFF